MARWSNKQLGKYQIKALLGKGAMAEVYQAYQPALDRDVAIKIIHPHLAQDPDFINRFKHEAKIVAALQHPAIVQIYDFDIEDNVFYMVMQFVPGTNLQKHLTTLYQQGAIMPLEEALPLFQQITQAVDYAHRQGVVHRDIKPANVLLNHQQQPFLVDFGLSNIIGTDRLAHSGIISGTPAYMSPEQGSGEMGDTRSDIYSLGVMLYEMSTGIPPFNAESPISTILKHLDDPLPLPRSINPDLPNALEAVIKTALEKDRANRFQSAQELLQAVRQLKPSRKLSRPEAAAEIDARCPYRGLQVFDTAHAEFFFGREALVEQLMDKLRLTLVSPAAVTPARFLAVVGASGSGKSSLVRAGLVPALKSGAAPASAGWQIRIFRPDSHPLEELTAQIAALMGQDHARLKADLAADGRSLHRAVGQAWADAPPGQKLALIVDQFEEIFTLCHNEVERWRFIENLLYAASVPQGRVMVILTMRADFYHRCTSYQDLANRISAQQLLVGPMSEAELRRAIMQPAHQVGLTFEPGLVDTVLADVAQQPGGLPLLQHALLELWERREGRLLTLKGYQASGGVSRAIAQRADMIYDGLTANEQTIVKRIMLRLTQPGEGTEDTRRRAKKEELLPRADVRQISVTKTVLQKLADARLITTSRDLTSGAEVVDVSHEALIRGWGRLRGWIDEDRLALRVHRQLTAAAQEWLRASQEPSYLYQGARLAQAEEWAEAHAADLNEQELVFLEASRAAARAAAEEKEQQRQRELTQAQALAEEQRQRAEIQSRASRRLRWFAAGLALMFMLAVGVAYVALTQWFEAQRQTEVAVNAQAVAETERSRAENQARLALSRQLAAQAESMVNDRLDLALLLSLEARQLVPDMAQLGQDPLFGLKYSPHLTKFLHGHTDLTDAVAFSPNSALLASASDDRTIILWDPATGQPLGPPLTGHTDQIRALAFSPDGSTLASAGRDAVIWLWDVKTGRTLGHFPAEHAGMITDLAFHPAGSLLASASIDRTVRLWNVQTGQVQEPPLKAHTDDVNSVAFSPDGQTLASASSDRTIVLWDIATRQPLGPPLIKHTDTINSLAFGPDGRFLASAGSDQAIVLWDMTSRQPHGAPLIGHGDLIQTVAFSPNGHFLASGSKDKTIRLWDIGSGQLLSPPWRSLEWVRDLAFSRDGQQLASAGDHYPILLWEVNASRYLHGHDEWVNSVAFSPDGRLLASGSDDRTVRLWDIERQLERGQPLIGHTDHVLSVAFSPTGQNLVSAGNDQRIMRWNVANGEFIAPPLTGHTNWISSLAFNPRQQPPLLASSSADQTVRRWNIETGQPAGAPLTEHTDGVLKVVYSPNGEMMASSGGKTVFLRDAGTGQLLGPPLLAHSDNVWALAFSPDGQTLASGSDDDTIILWDTATGQPRAAPLLGHTNDVWGLDFSHDGQILASGSRDNTLILWDPVSGQPLSPPLIGHANWVWGIDFSPTEPLLASGSRDSDIILWRVDATPLAARLCAIANRNLTLAEWQQLTPEQPYHKTCAHLPAAPDLLATAQELAKTNNISAATEIFAQVVSLDPESTINPNIEARKFAALGLIERGRTTAEDGNIDLAASLFQQALALNPALSLKPKEEARRLAALGLRTQGEQLAKAGDTDAAMRQFNEALRLDPGLPLSPQAEARRLAVKGVVAQGDELARSGQLEAAIAQFERALDLGAESTFVPETRALQLAAESLAEQAEELAVKGQIPEALTKMREATAMVPARAIANRSWHVLCRQGAIEQQAAAVLAACQRAVELAPYDGWIHDSRGLARAQTGDYAGAIEDFEFFVNWFAESPRFREVGLKRERWIAELEAGRNPLDPDTLALVQQE